MFTSAKSWDVGVHDHVTNLLRTHIVVTSYWSTSYQLRCRLRLFLIFLLVVCVFNGKEATQVEIVDLSNASVDIQHMVFPDHLRQINRLSPEER
jgi:hypothetical protein